MAELRNCADCNTILLADEAGGWTGTDDPLCVECMVKRKMPKTAASFLTSAFQTFRERNAQYGGNYQRMGTLILALFPPDGLPNINTEAKAAQLNLIIDCLGKLQRYAYNLHCGGHQDSAHDLIVYAAMLEELTQK